ncbi:cysteine peptidase family C39 domain-containing protein [Vibrio coralliilyticus]|uniref:cysteine peptidase family C39 domain-containing protein n=1 Tax=Vibrio coralliilyticus TaxID=190893 RepID=UPI0015605130|nr:cysteine peptidase family C39 domain-containing protein [Vibrio coralliilyticus]NRF12896.1 hypothetical protein [Vibrio coralliilyticus]
MADKESLASCVNILAQLSGKNIVKWCSQNDDVDINKTRKGIEKNYEVRLTNKKQVLKRVSKERLPLIFRDNNDHYHILAKMNDEQALVQSSFGGQPELISLAELTALWSGEVMFCRFKESRFDIRWFIPEFLRYKNLLGKVLVFSLMLQLLALISPLCFQVVMDKVLVHSALSTLDVLVVVCSGQQIPDTNLSRFSAVTGDSPSFA